MTKTKAIVVNDFMFCSPHGDEHCPICCCDHRMGNNVRVEEELEDVTEFFAFEAEGRHPINAYALGAVAAAAKPGAYQCSVHSEVDCHRCFNWVAIIKREAEVAEEDGRWPAGRGGWLDGGDGT